MFPFCPAGPYCGNTETLTVGCFSTEYLLTALQNSYCGAAVIDPRINNDRFPAGNGPPKLVLCTPWKFSSSGSGHRPNSAVIPPFGDLLRKVKAKFSGYKIASWEVALGYFVHDTNICIRQDLVLWIDEAAQGTAVDVVYVSRGDGGPTISMATIMKEHPLPERAMFFTEIPVLITEGDRPY